RLRAFLSSEAGCTPSSRRGLPPFASSGCSPPHSVSLFTLEACKERLSRGGTLKWGRTGIFWKFKNHRGARSPAAAPAGGGASWHRTGLKREELTSPPHQDTQPRPRLAIGEDGPSDSALAASSGWRSCTSRLRIILSSEKQVRYQRSTTV